MSYQEKRLGLLNATKGAPLGSVGRVLIGGGLAFAISTIGFFGPAEADDAALLAARQVTPTDFAGPTTPAKAPADIKIGVITCLSTIHGCVTPADGVRHAAEKLGWSVTVYDGGGTPSKENAAILDALSSGANVIATIAIDPQLVQLALAKAKQAGVPVVSGSNGIDTPNPVHLTSEAGLGYVYDIAPDYVTLGKQTAAWIIADSGGTANIAVYSDKEYPSVLALQDGLLEALKACAKCTVSPIQYFSATQIATQLGPQTVGYLRAHPEVNYVFGPFDPEAAVQVTAIAQAGFGDRVKLVSVVGDQQNMDFIRSGHVQVADAAYDNEYMGWAIVDQAIRMLNHQPLSDPHSENLPFVVLDKTNLPKPGGDWQASFDYQSKYLDLWH